MTGAPDLHRHSETPERLAGIRLGALRPYGLTEREIDELNDAAGRDEHERWGRRWDETSAVFRWKGPLANQPAGEIERLLSHPESEVAMVLLRRVAFGAGTLEEVDARVLRRVVERVLDEATAEGEHWNPELEELCAIVGIDDGLDLRRLHYIPEGAALAERIGERGREVERGVRALDEHQLLRLLEAYEPGGQGRSVVGDAIARHGRLTPALIERLTTAPWGSERIEMMEENPTLGAEGWQMLHWAVLAGGDGIRDARAIAHVERALAAGHPPGAAFVGALRMRWRSLGWGRDPLQGGGSLANSPTEPDSRLVALSALLPEAAVGQPWERAHRSRLAPEQLPRYCAGLDATRWLDTVSDLLGSLRGTKSGSGRRERAPLPVETFVRIVREVRGEQLEGVDDDWVRELALELMQHDEREIRLSAAALVRAQGQRRGAETTVPAEPAAETSPVGLRR